MKAAHVFDFDDTLSHSTAMIYAHPFYNGQPTEIHRLPGMQGVRHSKLEYLPGSLRYHFTSRDFAALAHAIDAHDTVRSVEHGNEVGDGHVVSLDFSDIIHVDHNDAQPIKKNILHLERAAAAGHDIWVLTGRKSGGEDGIAQFIESHSGVTVPRVRVICVGSWGGETHKNKARALISHVIPHDSYGEIHFYDDDQRNLDEAKSQVSPFVKLYLVNSITDAVSSDAKDRVARAKERRSSGSDLRRIRKLSGIV